jgi:hypothetical protein
MMFAGTPDDYNPNQLFICSNWEPDKVSVPIELCAQVFFFLKQRNAQFQRGQATPNLMSLQNKLLQDLRGSKVFIVIPSDENLGPCILECQEYHLSDGTTYRQLSSNEAQQAVDKTGETIKNFISDHSHTLGPKDETYPACSLDVPDPFAHFYIMAKVYKTTWAVRLILSVSGSTTHCLGRWLDQQLKPIVKKLSSCILSSFELKQRLQQMKFTPSRVSMFSCDAVLMYTNIDT